MEAYMCHFVLFKGFLNSVFGPCDSCILSFIFLFGLYCFGLAHYRGRFGLFYACVTQTIIYRTVQSVYMQISRRSHDRQQS